MFPSWSKHLLDLIQHILFKQVVGIYECAALAPPVSAPPPQ